MLPHQIEKKLANISQHNLWRVRESVRYHRNIHNLIQIKEHTCVDFSSNDYLGLRYHRKIAESITHAVKHFGNGSGSSSMISGYHEIQAVFEQRFADWLRVEKAILFNSGYHANLGVMTALSGRCNTIVSDKLCHASIIDGILLSRANHQRYKHCNISHLKDIVIRKKPDLVITENIFSMEGDIAPIDDIVKIANMHHAMTIIDDAHGIGISGINGRGAIDISKSAKESAVCIVAPLGKAFCGLGAIVAGRKHMLDAVLQSARTYRYTTALPPYVIAGLNAALDIIIHEQWRRDKLLDNITLFNQLTKSYQIELISVHETPIRSIHVKSHHNIMQIQQDLIKKGCYVSAIRPPTVPKHAARLRVSINALHTQDQIVTLVKHIKEALA